MRAWILAAVALVAGLALGWAARRPDDIGPEAVVRLVDGPATVVAVTTERRDPPTDGCLAEDRVAIAMLALPPDVPLPPPATESACRARIALAAALGTARQLDQIGRPVPFPDDLPEKYRQAGFTAVVRKVLAECPDLDVDLRKVDCTEFPCMALFVKRSGSTSPQSCEAWRAVYGDRSSTSTGILVGADGARFGYELVGPSVPEDIAPHEPSTMSEDGQMHHGNGMKRHMQRGRDARDEVMADLGARELTEEEKREDHRQFWREHAKEDPEAAARMIQSLEAQWASEDAR